MAVYYYLVLDRQGKRGLPAVEMCIRDRPRTMTFFRSVTTDSFSLPP